MCVRRFKLCLFYLIVYIFFFLLIYFSCTRCCSPSHLLSDIFFFLSDFLLLVSSMADSDPMYLVLCEIQKLSELLFSRAKLSGMIGKRIAAWERVCAYAHEVGYTPTQLSVEDFRRIVNKWRRDFKVMFPDFQNRVCGKFSFCLPFFFCSPFREKLNLSVSVVKARSNERNCVIFGPKILFSTRVVPVW